MPPPHPAEFRHRAVELARGRATPIAEVAEDGESATAALIREANEEIGIRIDDPSGWRLRLHIFLPGYFDRPHNHRWTYSSRILHGSYAHTLYGTGNIDVAALQPRMVRTESTGDFNTPCTTP